MKKLLIAAALLSIPIFGYAGTIYNFSAITANSAIDPGIGESQLSVEVSDAGSGLVKFTFSNSGPAASSITDVYFDDGTLLGINGFSDSGAGVAFSQGASPGDLPSGNNIDFNTSAGFSADSDPPAQPKGVNPGEYLNIFFDLQNGKTYADTIAALALSLANPGVDVAGGLRIGIHVQGFADGQSESFVNGPPVPEPGTMVLLGSGLVGLVGWGRLRFRK